MASAANITDPDVRAIFEAGEANGTLSFQYSTTPRSTTYYVFTRYDKDGFPHAGKMTKMQLVGEYGGRA
jgi:hypothetical protein